MVAFLLMGVGFGIHLAPLKKLESFKLLAVVGLVYNLFGVLILSEIVAKSEKLRLFIVNRFPYVLISAHFYVPLGLAMFSMWAYVTQRAAYPSGGTVATFALA